MMSGLAGPANLAFSEKTFFYSAIFLSVYSVFFYDSPSVPFYSLFIFYKFAKIFDMLVIISCPQQFIYFFTFWISNCNVYMRENGDNYNCSYKHLNCLQFLMYCTSLLMMHVISTSRASVLNNFKLFVEQVFAPLNEGRNIVDIKHKDIRP